MSVSKEKIIGCLLGGAVGDALGGPIEFSSLDNIRDQFGQEGIRDFVPAYGRMGAITDDTQMTLFTAEGLISARSRMLDRGTTMPVTLLYNAYLRWLVTQGKRPKENGFGFEVKSGDDLHPGWLSAIPELNIQRAPGNTCLGALGSGRAGIIEEEPINNSKRDVVALCAPHRLGLRGRLTKKLRSIMDANRRQSRMVTLADI